MSTREAEQQSRIRVAELAVELNRTIGRFLDANPDLTYEEMLLTFNQMSNRHIQHLMRTEVPDDPA